jgi:hypothetical protein
MVFLRPPLAYVWTAPYLAQGHIHSYFSINRCVVATTDTDRTQLQIKTAGLKHDAAVLGNSSAAVYTGNTFQDLPRLRDTADNTERYISHDIRVTYINTVKCN